ncbi:MAG: indole-3-glycerol phosphate synthase TrpC [Pseudoflavonifractor sp.]|nr:indole-3-glycerol phosphate synthase TrpC [Pseudoflavonifractor sp.]
MSNFLKKILEYKRREVEASKAVIPAETLRGMAREVTRPAISMSRALAQSPTGIIAECKRRSPSKGDIHPAAEAGEIVRGYERAGATACSVLTDTPFFGGALTDLAVARSTVAIPLLRKDFIIDDYQLCQARIYGADAVLLIASALDADTIAHLTDKAHELGLETLLELHSPDEVAKIAPATDMVGVNNRNLSTFATDTVVAERMARMLPDTVVRIAESGLNDMADVRRLQAMGYNGFLIGERFMKTPDPGLTLKNFIDGTI